MSPVGKGAPAGRDARVSPAPGEAARTLAIEDLMAGRQEVVIVHRGERYRLKITRRGKLILTK